MREPSAAAVAEESACVTELAKGVEVIEQQVNSKMNEVAHTEFSYFYQNAANDARPNFNICTTGSHAN